MKQGHASRSGREGTKVEPHSRAVSPGGASQLGSAQAKRASVDPLFEGRGYEAPKAGKQVHHHGSQGKR